LLFGPALHAVHGFIMTAIFFPSRPAFLIRQRVSPVADSYYAVVALSIRELIGEWFQSSNTDLTI
jgi:hypothetical protein